MPIKNSRIETRIGRLYLREIEVTNLLVTAAIDRQSIKVSPLQLAVNGGPINGSADLQLGVPGSRYDIRFNVDRVPIRPALQSFSPTIGQTARGEIVADLRVAGTGQTGRSLRQSLNGTFSFYLTNAMIKLTPDSQPVQSSAQSGLLSSFKGAGQEFMSSGLSSIAGVLGIPDLTRSPITHIATVVEMGGGAINLRNADVRSSMFMVHAAGSIPIQDVLTNSPLKIPVDVWLSKSAASRLTLGGGNEPFSKLPTFVEMRGTLGAPETFIDKTVTAQIVGSAALGLLKGTGGDLGKAAESMLKGGAGDIGGALGGLFGGGKKPPAGGNQQPQKGLGGALGGLFGGQPKKQTPQQPGTTKTNTPGKNPFELFNLIPKK